MLNHLVLLVKTFGMISEGAKIVSQGAGVVSQGIVFVSKFKH